MRKFEYEINGKNYQVTVEEITGSEAAIQVNGETYHVSFKRPAAAGAPAPVKAAQDQPAPPPAAPSPTPPRPAPAASASAITAPMPGVVLEVRVKEGDSVSRTDVLLILEAMKMENEIKSGRAGKIKAVKVVKGSSVNTGDVMIEFE